jgi:hypothetical protein
MLASFSRASATTVSSDWEEILSVPTGYAIGAGDGAASAAGDYISAGVMRSSATHTAATYTPG